MLAKLVWAVGLHLGTGVVLVAGCFLNFVDLMYCLRGVVQLEFLHTWLQLAV